MKFLFGRRSHSTDDAAPATRSPALRPSASADALIARGNELEDAGDAAAALRIYQDAAAAFPESWRAYNNIGNALRILGRLSEATANYRQAIALHPDCAELNFNLGNVLLEMGRAEEASESYQSAICLRSEWPDAWFGLARALERCGRIAEAVQTYRTSIRLGPGQAAASAALARILLRQGAADAAEDIVSQALEHAPRALPLVLAKAEIDQQLGDAEAAAAAYRHALDLAPDDFAIRSAYLFALNFVETINPASLLRAHREYGERIERRVQRLAIQPAFDPDKRLRIGYVSPDFRRHSVACFIEPLLRHHDRSNAEVHCYYNHTVRDDITQRFTQLADRWTDIAAMDDDVVARRIADDGIDILIDLAGHTSGNRLGVFARKPAPLQLTWLGYLGTTGLAAMDGRLCDAATDPAGIAEAWQTEEPLRLPNAQWCYQPQTTLPDAGPLPRLTNGYWTFGSFNQAAKLGPQLIALWARLLATIPDSRIRVLGIPDGRFADRIRHAFSAQGVADERVDIEGRVPFESYFQRYRDVDIALDSLPYNGATTTCDALAIGVPIATVAGDRAIARGGASLLGTLGLDAWIARSGDELIQRLVELTREPKPIATLRRNLPAHMRASALMDGPRFARDFEALLRAKWRQSVLAAP